MKIQNLSDIGDFPSGASQLKNVIEKMDCVLGAFNVSLSVPLGYLVEPGGKLKHTATVEIGRNIIVKSAIDRICALSLRMSCDSPVLVLASSVLTRESWRLVRLSWRAK